MCLHCCDRTRGNGFKLEKGRLIGFLLMRISAWVWQLDFRAVGTSWVVGLHWLCGWGLSPRTAAGAPWNGRAAALPQFLLFHRATCNLWQWVSKMNSLLQVILGFCLNPLWSWTWWQPILEMTWTGSSPMCLKNGSCGGELHKGQNWILDVHSLFYKAVHKPSIEAILALPALHRHWRSRGKSTLSGQDPLAQHTSCAGGDVSPLLQRPRDALCSCLITFWWMLP